jgi:hypothetical protein
VDVQEVDTVESEQVEALGRRLNHVVVREVFRPDLRGDYHLVSGH